MNEDMKIVTVKGGTGFRNVTFRIYKYAEDNDPKFSFDIHCIEDDKGIIERIKKGWMVLCGNYVPHYEMYFDENGKDKVRKFLKEWLELMEGE